MGDQFKEVDTTNVDGAWFTRLLQHGLTGFTPFYTIAQGPYGGGGRRFQCICKHAGIAGLTSKPETMVFTIKYRGVPVSIFPSSNSMNMILVGGFDHLEKY